MRRIIITLVSLLASLWAYTATAADLQLVDNPPSQYTVKKGDTLWAISGRFLTQPWRWPEIWGMNREEIKNPHLIYPGDVIVLDYVGGQARLRKAGSGSAGSGSAGSDTARLSPMVRREPIGQAIPSIPSAAIEPFLTRPLVVEKDALGGAPTIVATESERVIVGAGNTAYVEGLDGAQSSVWQVYRTGSKLTDPETQEILGYEAVYLGDARVSRLGEPATVNIFRSTQEIYTGDKLVIASEAVYPSYIPHSPDKPIKGRIMSVPGGVSEIGQNAIVTINRGARDGVEVGHVLASYRLGDTVKAPSGKRLKLPDERNGLVFVFRTFDRVSYALIVQSLQALHINDVVQTPE
jgi:hypothetical protein